jgi:hypothetical protein
MITRPTRSEGALRAERGRLRGPGDPRGGVGTP